ncbi:RXLR domain-containing protein [Phytophthora infestans]|uniref:RxLR effector protein n=1 Tax=Phytophthora infestans TaxID=4787 RepID=A0A833SQ42_PHYIN|nr:RXLR domain-containing protein [Phytophthora infestans]
MHLQSFLMMVVATLIIVNGSVSAADSFNLRKVKSTSPVNAINTVKTELTNSRMLRGADLTTGDNGHVYYYPARNGERKPFIEAKLKKALANPKRVNRLYANWYKSGFSAKRVAKELNQSVNNELGDTYYNLAKGYATFVKRKKTQQHLL